MERHILSKSTFIRGSQCLKSLYLNKKRPYLRDKISDSKRAIFKRGTDIGVIARDLFPGGIDLSPRSPSQYQRKVLETTEIIRQGKNKILYEAAFQYSQMLILLDILVKQDGLWIAYEVKSSLSITPTFLLDAAFQYYIMKNSGFAPEAFYLVYINENYIKKGEINLNEYFLKKNILPEIIQMEDYIIKLIKKEKAVLKLNSSPDIPVGEQCDTPYTCDFKGHCWKKIPETSILYMDAFDNSFKFEWWKKYGNKLEGISKFISTKKQYAQIYSSSHKELYVDKNGLNSYLEKINNNYPVLSVLFIMPAMPVFENTKPYQLIPVGFSLNYPGINKTDIVLTIDHQNPILYFIEKFRKALLKHEKLISYDSKYLIRFFDENHEKKNFISKDTIISLSEVLKIPYIYHYKIKSDYSEKHISSLLLNMENKNLDNSLLSMNWFINKLREENCDSLKKQSENYLKHITNFTNEFYKFIEAQTDS